MPDTAVSKRWYEILSSLTPLILGLAATGLGTFFTATNDAQQAQLNRITALDKFRPLLSSNNESDREFAYSAFAALGYEALALKMIRVTQDPAGRAAAEEIKQSSGAAERAAASAVLSATPAKVYIHIASESQRDPAKALAEKLRAGGHASQGIENILGKATPPAQTTVRYFNPEDQAAASSIVDSLKAIGETSAVAQIVTRYRVRPGSIEVWFGKPAQP